MEKLTQKNKKNLKTIGVVLFVIYIFGLCFSWSISTEYDSAPDELMKYDVCKYICSNLKLPHGGDESIRNPTWGLSYAFTPILSYMFSAVFMRIAMLITQNEFYIVVAARFVSVLCMVGYAITCIKIANKLFKGIYKWLFIVMVTLLPQLVYLGSYINNDSLALLSISIIIYGWILGLEKNWDWKSCIIMAIGIGICALSYYNAYGYILCSVIIYFASSYMKKIKIKEFLKKGIVITIIACAIAGWWFVRNFILYDGDFLGINVSREYGEMYAMEPYKPSNRETPAHQNVSLKYMLVDMKWFKITKSSFIGRFGYMTVPLSKTIYKCYESVLLLGLIGIVVGWIKIFIQKMRKKNKNESEKQRKRKQNEKILWNMIMIISCIIPIILSLYYSYFSDFQPQGRYIMPMIIPFMYFVVNGIKNVFHTFIRNKKIQNILLSIVIIIWSIMPIYIFFTYIEPL